MNPYYSFDDIFLFPQYSECISRKEIDTSVTMGDFSLKTPIMSANMDTILGAEMAIEMFNIGAIGSLHRFMTIDENVDEYKKVTSAGADCFVSVGVNGDSRARSSELYRAGARHFVVDIAHGHSIMMKETLAWFRSQFKDTAYIIAGNIATPQAVKDLSSWGADVAKVGVSGGSACITNLVTGHGVPMFSCLLECSEVADSLGVKIIADGGIKTSGDIVKSLAAGADMIMAGALFSGTDETPGKFINTPNGVIKEFRGMASSEAMESRYGNTRTNLPAAEGVKTSVAAKGPVRPIVDNLTKGLKSGMSYCNATTLPDISVKAKYGVRTGSGYKEGTPHILTP